MLGVSVPEGSLFYGQPRRRTLVAIDAALRATTEEAAARLHRLFDSGITPPAIYDKDKCERCSLIEICKPRVGRSVSRYLAETLQ
jgi:CRISPR-associated exonuclease Cas4